MERIPTLFCAALLSALFFNRSANAQAQAAEAQHHTEPRTNGPTGFEENKGQVLRTDGQPAPFVKYRLAQGNALVFLLENGIAYQFNKSLQDPEFARLMGKLDLTPAERTRFEKMKAERRSETYRMDMVLEGARPDPRITTTGRSTDHTNYYNHPSGLEYASLDVHCYQQVVYHDVYPGIDWSLSLNGEGIEQDFIVAPGADPSAIKLRFKDHEELFVDDNGRLIHGNRLGRFTEEKPVSWQGAAQVRTDFRLDDDLLSFTLGDYDRSRELRIDPPRVWATYSGGTQDDILQGVAVDVAGSTYVVGWTSSVNAIASLNGYDLSLSGAPDCMLVKFDQGGQRVWGTYFGGAGEDRFGYCALDAVGTSLYASGLSASPGLATVGQTTLGGGPWDALLAKFTTDGAFEWSTFYGGDQEDKARHCATDQGGNVYITGHTFSDPPPGQWPIASGPSVHQSSYGGGTTGLSYSTGDGFLAKFNSSGARIWGTYYGGSNDDEAYGCATDLAGNVYICGGTGFVSDTSIASPNGYQTVFGQGPFTGGDAYLAKFSPSGVRQWGTYYGGNDDDRGYDCCVDHDGNVYLSGITKSSGPVGAIHAGAGHQATYAQGGGDGFLVKFSADGDRLWGTYHGGNAFDVAYSCAVDNVNRVYLAGSTSSTNAAAIALHAHQATFQGTEDAFLAGFEPGGTWVWGTYYGGTAGDVGYTVRPLTDQSIYMVGHTLTNAPPNGAISQEPGWQLDFGGSSDGFLVRFDYRIDCNGVPGGDLQVGTPCDDGDNYTVNDALDDNCICGGNMSCNLPIPVTLDQTDSQDLSGSVAVAQSNRWYRLDITACVDLTLHLCAGSNISGLVLAYLYDACPSDGFDFFETTGANGCGGSDMTWEDVPAGTYYYEMTVTGDYFGQFITTPCSEVVDCQGVVGGPALPGTACNDGNACTTNDVYTGTAPNCTCAGTLTTVTPTVSITANPNGAICAGTSVTFTAAPSNTGGGTVSYQWKLNGANVGTNSSTYANAGLTNGNQVSCVITIAGGACLSSTTATSNTITMVVTTSITPSVTLVADPSGAICDGTTVVFTATASNTGGGTVTYNFRLNGVTAQNNSSNTWSMGALADGDEVYVQITVIGGSCLSSTQATSQTITVDVGSSITPAVAITANPSGAICAGTSVTFTAAPINTGGGTVSYQWKLNGANVGTNSSTYTNAGLANGNQVSCVITIAGGACLSSTTATSNTITMVVTTSITPSVSITADPSGAICAGTSVTFTAAPSNTGGGTVSYQWKLNGANVGTNLSTYTNASLVNGNQVGCVITIAGGACLSSTTATSNTITMDVDLSVTPSVSITADPSGAICTGTNVTFTATPGNLGGGTVSYQWKLNGEDVGTNSSTYTNAALVNDDQVSCVITVSGGACLSSTTATSNTITMVVTTSITPSVTLVADPAGTICDGTTVVFTATASGTGGGTISYDFDLNGVTAQNNASNTWTVGVLEQGDEVVCTITVIGGSCLSTTQATSEAITINVESSITPQVSITADPNGPICAGTSVTFTATPSNTSGGTLSYQWKLNGANVGADAPTYTNSTLADNDDVGCVITVTGGACLSTNTAASNTITSEVNALPMAFALTGGGLYCEGGAGVAIGLAGSHLGITYELYLNGGSDPVAQVAGTNNTLEFPPQTGVGTYTVIAISPEECIQAMTGTAVITLDDADGEGDGIPDCSDSCPLVAGEVGSPCDDNNPDTDNDLINNACVCEGQECSPGNACTDFNDCTINDTWDSGCVCTGVGLLLGPIQGNSLVADGVNYVFSATVSTNDFDHTEVPADQFLWQWTATPSDDWYSPDWAQPVLQAHADSVHGPVELCVTATIGSCPALEECMTVLVVDVGVSENMVTDPFSVRPNPSAGLFWIIDDAQVGVERLAVEDATGRTIPVVTQGHGVTRTIDLGDAVPGIYLLRIWHDHGTQVLRLVVRR